MLRTSRRAAALDAPPAPVQITAAKVILLSPELRGKYEKGGLAALDEDALMKNGIQVRPPPLHAPGRAPISIRNPAVGACAQRVPDIAAAAGLRFARARQKQQIATPSCCASGERAPRVPCRLMCRRRAS
jgi:hypothetical protein